MVACNIFGSDGCFGSVLCAGFACDTKFSAQVVDAIRELCSICAVITV